MKLITDKNMRSISSITASSSDEYFPTANLLTLDPSEIWKADSFLASCRLVIDCGSAVAIPQIWLNNANFLNCTLQANDSNDWASPAVSKDVILASDDIGIYKGYFDLSSANYRYISILIPVQTLLDSDTVPTLGNVIVGNALELKVASWDFQIENPVSIFRPDSGGYRRQNKGRGRHIFTISLQDSKPAMDSRPLKGWDIAVIFTDLADVADSYLVYVPINRRGSTRNINEQTRSETLEEYL